MLDPFHISDPRVVGTLGRKGLHQVGDLGTRVLRDRCLPPEAWICRYAPSIIARSEAELFGISMPRFAIRIYLDKEQENFVNARRIGEFAQQARSWATRRPDTGGRLQGIEPRRFSESPRSIIRRNTCVGDCLLQFRGPGAWHVLEAELGRAYGERAEFKATPYVKHISVAGGGLCAQAVAFMATALLHPHCRGAYGVAEVTALATEPLPDPNGQRQPQPPVTELALTGLVPAEVLRYFSHPMVGLRATHQVAHSRWGRPPNEAFEDALTAYLRSGMPVILPLDSGRMGGVGSAALPLDYPGSISARNGIPAHWVRERHRRRHRRHAVLLVGCDQLGHFLFNDPGTYPFLVARIDELAGASCYSDDEMTQLAECIFLPVTPSAVKLPLEAYFEPAGPDGGIRLTPEQRALSYMVDALEYRLECRNVSCGTQRWRSRLLRAHELQSSDIFPRDAAGALQKALASWLGRCKEHWCWLQVAEGAVCVWDAELEPPPTGTLAQVIDDHILCLLVRDGAGWSLVQSGSPKEQRQEAGPTPVTTGPFAQGALITSFRTGPLEQVIREWPDERWFADIYGFMQPDVRSLFPWSVRAWALRAWRGLYTLTCQAGNLLRLLPWRFSRQYRWWIRAMDYADRRGLPVPPAICTATERMAFGARSSEPHRVAAKAHELLRRRGVQCAAVTSFIPEFASSTSDGRRWPESALRFLVLFTAELRRLGHPLCTLEVVGGTLIDGVWPGIRKDAEHDRTALSHEREVFVANRLSGEEGLRRLLDALQRIAPWVRQVAPGLGLALELEPGPLFTLQDGDSLRRLCQLLDSEYRDCSDIIGLNLDVAHWSLARMTPEWVAEHEPVLGRILHAHVSDHGHGHFGDAQVGSIHHHADSFARWLDLLRLASLQNAEGLPARSGFVSIELEACREQGMVTGSMAFLEGNQLVRT